MTLPMGASGYFSTPANTLDPNIFDGMTLKPEVRHMIISTACKAMTDEGFRKPEEWLGLWITGSGITYQWDAKCGCNAGKTPPGILAGNNGYTHPRSSDSQGQKNIWQ